jgi:hypothetical protein
VPAGASDIGRVSLRCKKRIEVPGRPGRLLGTRYRLHEEPTRSICARARNKVVKIWKHANAKAHDDALRHPLMQYNVPDEIPSTPPFTHAFLRNTVAAAPAVHQSAIDYTARIRKGDDARNRRESARRGDHSKRRRRRGDRLPARSSCGRQVGWSGLTDDGGFGATGSFGETDDGVWARIGGRDLALMASTSSDASSGPEKQTARRAATVAQSYTILRNRQPILADSLLRRHQRANGRSIVGTPASYGSIHWARKQGMCRLRSGKRRQSRPDGFVKAEVCRSPDDEHRGRHDDVTVKSTRPVYITVRRRSGGRRAR